LPDIPAEWTAIEQRLVAQPDLLDTEGWNLRERQNQLLTGKTFVIERDWYHDKRGLFAKLAEIEMKMDAKWEVLEVKLKVTSWKIRGFDR
jgi:hypothetical protein